MIRILHMIGSLNIGGSQAMIMNLYRNINREKIQFDFILDHPDQLYFADEVKSLGGRLYFLPEFKGTNYFEVKKKWDIFFKEHPEYKVLHSHVRSYASIYLPIARKFGLKTIIHSHSTSNGSGMKSYIKWMLQLPLRYQADYFFSCSKEAGEWLFGKKIVSSSRYYMIKNAIEVEAYAPDSEIRTSYRETIQVSDDTILFGHIGRFHPAKNHSFLLEIFNALHNKLPNTKLILVGDGELRNQIEEQIKILSLEEDVIMMGARDDVPNILKAMDVFLFPSKWEGLPVTVVEAQAAGLPCLISDYVTKDVKISELAMYLSIDNGVDVWVDKIQSLDFQRKNVIDNIRMAGFDVKTTATWMENFYSGLANF